MKNLSKESLPGYAIQYPPAGGRLIIATRPKQSGGCAIFKSEHLPYFRPDLWKPY